MSVKARCLNYTGCLLAYRGEVIDLAANAPLVCPECGKTVSVVRSGGGGAVKALIWLAVLGALGAGGYFAYPFLGKYVSKKQPTEEVESTPPPASTPRMASTSPASTPTRNTNPPAATPLNTPPTNNDPPAKAFSPPRLDLSLKTAENQKVREDVLKRIDVMPNISGSNKDRLYLSVTRARSMGLIVTIPFASGSAKLPPGEVPNLKTALESPEIAKLRQDPTCVFVVLGYADPKGDEKKNLSISQSRAESVLDSMREKCGMTSNVLHAVAMGGSKLLDTENLEKNRVVEVWAVLP